MVSYHFSSSDDVFNPSRPRQNGHHFADDTLKRISMNGNIIIAIKISLKFVPKGQICNFPTSRVTLYTAGLLHTAVPHRSHSRAPIVHTAVPRENNEHGCVYLRCRAVCKLPGCVEGHPWTLVDTMAWRPTGDKPSPEPMIITLLTHVCVTRPQWLKTANITSEIIFETRCIWNILSTHLSSIFLEKMCFSGYFVLLPWKPPINTMWHFPYVSIYNPCFKSRPNNILTAICLPSPLLRHWGRGKMDAISQTPFWNVFSWMKMYQFCLKFHWSS